MIKFYVYVGSKKVDVAHTTSNGDKILWKHELFSKLHRYASLFSDGDMLSGGFESHITDIVDFNLHFMTTYKVEITLSAEYASANREDAVNGLYDLLQIALDDVDIQDEIEEE